MARPVGHSQMSSISNLIADSSSSRVFAGFFKRVRLFLRAHSMMTERSPALGGFWGLGAEPRRLRNIRSLCNQLLRIAAVPMLEPSLERWSSVIAEADARARAAARSF